MDFSLSEDLWQVIGLTVGLGALGGFTADVVYPIQRSDVAPKTGLENRFTFPRLFRATRGGKSKLVAADLGVLGPMVVGVVTALIAVFAIGVSGPASDDAAQATAEISQRVAVDPEAAEPDAEVLESASDKLSSRVSIAALIPLALIGGFGGHLFLEAAMTRVTTLLGAAAIVGARPAVEGAVKGVEQAAEDLNLDQQQTDALMEAAQEAGAERAREAVESLEWKPSEPEPPAPAGQNAGA